MPYQLSVSFSDDYGAKLMKLAEAQGKKPSQLVRLEIQKILDSKKAR